VIADVFLLTPQHAQKAMESGRLMQLSAADLLKSPYGVRYVFAHHKSRLFRNNSGGEAPDLEERRLSLDPLERELLAPNPVLPPEYKLRWDVRTRNNQLYGRLYEIERPQ
jgi:hypothetical protein